MSLNPDAVLATTGLVLAADDARTTAEPEATLAPAHA